MSGTNVSYLSNFSAIKLDIIRFKNKPSKGDQSTKNIYFDPNHLNLF